MLAFIPENHRYNAVEQGCAGSPASVGRRYLRFNVCAIVAQQTGFSSFTPRHFESLRESIANAKRLAAVAAIGKAHNAGGVH